jgi:hypothetical protein
VPGAGVLAADVADAEDDAHVPDRGPVAADASAATLAA